MIRKITKVQPQTLNNFHQQCESSNELQQPNADPITSNHGLPFIAMDYKTFKKRSSLKVD